MSLPAEQKRELVRRVADSKAFGRSSAMRAFLLYITDQAISGKAEKLKEQTIGTHVLGRKPDYDPADDNIVRVRAHELRGRLEKYFASEGLAEPVVITIPKGSYMPEFAPRKVVPVEAPLTPLSAVEITVSGPTAPHPMETAPAATKNEAQRRLRKWLFQASILLLTAAVSAVATRYAVRRGIHTSEVEPEGAMHDFWAQFFVRPNEELKIIYSDTSFALWQDLNNKTLGLGDYINYRYLNVPDNNLFNEAARRVTSPADISAGVQLATLTSEFGGYVALQFARDIDAEFLHDGNVVLLGSHRSNPWVEVYEPSLNFQVGQDPHSGAPVIRNLSPRAREASIYAIPAMFDTQRTEEKVYTSYGVIALLKGCGSRGLTVLAEGLNTQATQAVGDMITNPQRLTALLHAIGHKPGTSVTPFEALIQVTSMPGGYDNPQVIAFRLRQPESCVGS